MIIDIVQVPSFSHKDKRRSLAFFHIQTNYFVKKNSLEDSQLFRRNLLFCLSPSSVCLLLHLTSLAIHLVFPLQSRHYYNLFCLCNIYSINYFHFLSGRTSRWRLGMGGHDCILLLQFHGGWCYLVQRSHTSGH